MAKTVTALLVVASAAALMSRTMDAGEFQKSCCKLEMGMTREPFRLLGDLGKMGYRLENLVEMPGTMSHRGGIIDVWPPTAEFPVRLEFFGDSIDSIRRFDPETQRSVEVVPSVAIGPAAELLAPRRLDKTALRDILDRLDLAGCNTETSEKFRQDFETLLAGEIPPEAQLYTSHCSIMAPCLITCHPGRCSSWTSRLTIDETAEQLHQEAEQLRAEKLERGELPGNFPRPYFTRDELAGKIGERQRLELAAFGMEGQMDFISAPGYAGRLPLFIKKTVELLGQGSRVVIVSHQASRLSDLLEGEGIVAAPVEAISQIPGPGELALVQGSLPEGWVMGGDTYLFTDAEIFGFVKQRRLSKKRPTPHHKLMVDIIPR